MDLALKTTASPAAIWVIVVVAIVLLAFWLFMVLVFATRPDPRLRPAASVSGPVPGGIQMAAGGHSVAASAEPIPAQRSAADSPAPADTAGSGAGGSP
jgi:hypothetical protein